MSEVTLKRASALLCMAGAAPEPYTLNPEPIKELLPNKDTRRPWGGPMLLGLGLSLDPGAVRVLFRGTGVPLGGDPTVGLCLGPYGPPRVWAFSYERGTPVTRVGTLWGT